MRELRWNAPSYLAVCIASLPLAGCGGGGGDSQVNPGSRRASCSGEAAPGTEDDDPTLICEPPTNGPAANQPPVLWGNPTAQIALGSGYSFTPQAWDPDGDALLFSVRNLPAWASFDPGNGRLQGTPAPSDVGSYTNIRIFVSDDKTIVELPEFGIDVLATATAGATLSWDPPTRNADGSPLTNLAGYLLLYGVESRVYSTKIEIDNPGLTAFSVDGLAPGKYFFAMRAVNLDGDFSALSSEVAGTVE